MALVKCPECGKEMSEFAESCLNCGSPIFDYFDKQKKLDNLAKQFCTGTYVNIIAYSRSIIGAPIRAELRIISYIDAYVNPGISSYFGISVYNYRTDVPDAQTGSENIYRDGKTQFSRIPLI